MLKKSYKDTYRIVGRNVVSCKDDLYIETEYSNIAGVRVRCLTIFKDDDIDHIKIVLPDDTEYLRQKLVYREIVSMYEKTTIFYKEKIITPRKTYIFTKTSVTCIELIDNNPKYIVIKKVRYE